MNNQNRPSTPFSTRFVHIEIPVHTLGFEKKGEPAEDAFSRRDGGLLSIVAPPDWIHSSLVEHAEYAMMLHLLSSLISVDEREPPRIGGGDGGGAVEAADDGTEVTEVQWPSEMA
ncbi:hypothetical protein QJS10_CPA16g00733 [Acorus calamus]|uniref:Uncharacterized protein n=1 Tax=Acorus calamus TaxID=4465 RepID=A0AAV9D3K1_ACOCL|nr:hypothetical protein QJS10_CPA16g00733 [Acorus calamus]